MLSPSGACAKTTLEPQKGLPQREPGQLGRSLEAYRLVEPGHPCEQLSRQRKNLTACEPVLLKQRAHGFRTFGGRYGEQVLEEVHQVYEGVGLVGHGILLRVVCLAA